MNQRKIPSSIFFNVDESLPCQTSWREIWGVLFIFRFHMKLLPTLEAGGKLEHYHGFLLQIVVKVEAQVLVRYFGLFDRY